MRTCNTKMILILQQINMTGAPVDFRCFESMPGKRLLELFLARFILAYGVCGVIIFSFKLNTHDTSFFVYKLRCTVRRCSSKIPIQLIPFEVPECEL